MRKHRYPEGNQKVWGISENVGEVKMEEKVRMGGWPSQSIQIVIESKKSKPIISLNGSNMMRTV